MGRTCALVSLYYSYPLQNLVKSRLHAYASSAALKTTTVTAAVYVVARLYGHHLDQLQEPYVADQALDLVMRPLKP